MLEPGFSYGDMTDPLIFERDATGKALSPTGSAKPWDQPETVLSCLGRVREVEGGRSGEVVINNRTVTLKMYKYRPSANFTRICSLSWFV